MNGKRTQQAGRIVLNLPASYFSWYRFLAERKHTTVEKYLVGELKEQALAAIDFLDNDDLAGFFGLSSDYKKYGPSSPCYSTVEKA